MKNNLSNIKKAIKYLNNNHCVAIPTETVYGLAANAYSNRATKKIFKLKRRPKNNPLIVHYDSLEKLMNDCEVNELFFKLFKKFSPGPISYVLRLKKNSKISKNVTNGKKTLAVRFPSHGITRNLLKKINYPLAAPSANISNRISPVTAQDVFDELGNKVKYILEGGKCKIGLESTIVNLTDKPNILRLGGIPKNKISKFFNSKEDLIRKSKVITPGMGNSHYSPNIPIRLNISKPKKNEAFLLIQKKNKKGKNYFYLSKNRNLAEVGKNLYKTLRNIKKKGFASIAVEKIPNHGIGETINDRLIRAAKKL